MSIPTQITPLAAGTVDYYNLSGGYLDWVAALNNNSALLAEPLTTYGQTTLTAIFNQYPTTAAMQAYVQSVAFSGVEPSTLGSANQVLALDGTATAIVGITDAQLINKIITDIQLQILIYS